MKLGIMQPYFFPYLGYFSLISYSDDFIFFDTPQYISKGWINRNRILKQDGTWGYITIPIKKMPRETAIMDVVINETEPWREKIYGQLSIYKRKAPYYKQIIDLVSDVIDFKKETRSLANCCIDSIVKTCEYLDIKRDFRVFSLMNLKIDRVSAPDEWALEICKAMGAETYVNPPGGMSFFSSDKYRKNGIQLEFLQNKLTPYIQRNGHFEEGLSIIDVLMFNSREDTKELINHYIIL